MNKKYQVFISSTYDDLKEERKNVINTILEMNCIPAGMEAFCAEDEEQFEVIKKVIDLCDYYILIIGKRYGSISQLTGKSYTEMEYDYAIEKGIPVLVFIADKSVNLREDNNQEKLKTFKEKAYGKRMGVIWKNSDDLSKHVATSLSKSISEHKRPGWTRDNVFDQDELLSQLNVLRIEKEKIETNYNKLEEDNEKLKEEIKKLNEQLNSDTDSSNDIIPIEELIIKVDYSYFSDKYTIKVKALDIFKYVSIKMIGVSFSQKHLNDQILNSLNIGGGTLKDNTLLERICNYFISLKLMSIKWNEKGHSNYYSLTKKGILLRDKLNGFFKC